jgi:hypothetical protein
VSNLEQARAERDEAISAATSMMGRVFPAFDGMEADPHLLSNPEERVGALRLLNAALASPDRAAVWSAEGSRSDLLPDLMALVEKALAADSTVKDIEGKTGDPE